ncbi:hypothetical protein GCM10025875_14230 [Litorihabitans aurantiacus]|uniref:Uncharacterized protein n=1 Tax=Litorihabitans aurantiacus TaxID=1930061 RepID=A0AA37XE05_9MICO|nr:hypothetical protein GCM10025875_14230 [Litorihabitans aurantiacus]
MRLAQEITLWRNVVVEKRTSRRRDEGGDHIASIEMTSGNTLRGDGEDARAFVDTPAVTTVLVTG